jgi:methylmalonyl-CoA carboxyltransferase 12S subunit
MVNSRTNEMGGIDAIVTALEELRGVVRELSARVSALEKKPPVSADPPRRVVAAAPPAPSEDAISDDTLTAIAAAVAAFLGKRAHVRQVRLISSSAWAQQGRVSVQASHRLER